MAENEKREVKTSGKSPLRRALAAGLSLAVISALCMVLVVKTDEATRALIDYNQKEAKIVVMAERLMPQSMLRGSTIHCHVISDERIGSDMRIYTIDRRSKTLGYLMTYSTDLGYAIPLVMIGAFDTDKKVLKTDVLISNETPGLGDQVDRDHGNFLDMMNGKGRDDARWDVKKFGGDFDFITGSTVTSRAVVLATRDALDALSEADIKTLASCGSIH